MTQTKEELRIHDGREISTSVEVGIKEHQCTRGLGQKGTQYVYANGDQEIVCNTCKRGGMFLESSKAPSPPPVLY